jgi:hypothetical protein
MMHHAVTRIRDLVMRGLSYHGRPGYGCMLERVGMVFFIQDYHGNSVYCMVLHMDDINISSIEARL